MVDPVLNFLNALWLIFTRLPDPYISLFHIVFVFSSLIMFLKIMFAEW